MGYIFFRLFIIEISRLRHLGQIFASWGRPLVQTYHEEKKTTGRTSCCSHEGKGVLLEVASWRTWSFKRTGWRCKYSKKGHTNAQHTDRPPNVNNSAPENGWLEKLLSLWEGHFSGARRYTLNFRGDIPEKGLPGDGTARKKSWKSRPLVLHLIHPRKLTTVP